MVSELYLCKGKYYIGIGRNTSTDGKAKLLLQGPICPCREIGWKGGVGSTASVLPLLPEKPTLSEIGRLSETLRRYLTYHMKL
jgi:hypothetical protein